MKKYRLGKAVELESFDTEACRRRWRTVHRIVALREFKCGPRTICAGEAGGLVESEDSLSQDGSCWIADGASCLEDARVFGDALVSGNASVKGGAAVGGEVIVTGRAEVSGEARAVCRGTIGGDAALLDRANVGAGPWRDTFVSIDGGAVIAGAASVRGTLSMSGEAKLAGCASVRAADRSAGTLSLLPGVELRGGAAVFDGLVECTEDVAVLFPAFSLCANPPEGFDHAGSIQAMHLTYNSSTGSVAFAPDGISALTSRFLFKGARERLSFVRRFESVDAAVCAIGGDLAEVAEAGGPQRAVREALLTRTLDMLEALPRRAALPSGDVGGGGVARAIARSIARAAAALCGRK